MLRSCRKLGLTRQTNVLSCYRNLSEVVQQSFAVRQGGNVRIEMLGGEKHILEITTAWQDHCVVEYDYEKSFMSDYKLNIDGDTLKQELTILARPGIESATTAGSPIRRMRVTLPEMMNVNIVANQMDLRVKNKLLGDFSYVSNGGSVEVDKLRGTSLMMTCEESDVKVNTLLEGSSTIVSKSLKAKMINGEQVYLITKGSTNVGAIYAQDSVISTETGDVFVGLMQGNIKIKALVGDVSVMGVDGSFDIAVSKGDIKLQLNKLNSSSSKQLSTATAEGGNIAVTVDPELASGVTVESSSNNIQILSDAFEKNDTSCEKTDSVVGILTGQSKGLKRPTFYKGESTSGKIDMRGADIQSMHSVNPLDTELRTPSLKLAASGSVKLETMSWIEAIRRKHMDDGPGMPEIPMGKRAAAFQRLGAITEASTTAAIAAAAAAATSTSIVSTPTKAEVTNDVQDLHKANVTLNLDNIPGMQTEGEKYIIVLTCSICETRTARKISKKAYHNGVVICRCEKCKNLHLLADRMGVFEDASWDAQSHEKRMSTILERQNITVSHENDILEVTEAVQSDSDSDSDSDDDKPKKQSN